MLFICLLFDCFFDIIFIYSKKKKIKNPFLIFLKINKNDFK